MAAGSWLQSAAVNIYRVLSVVKLPGDHATDDPRAGANASRALADSVGVTLGII
jgi:hypothetical protein